MAQSNDSKCFQIAMRMNCPDCGLPNCGRWLGHEDMAQESIKKQHLQIESEIEDKCRADLMYWQDAEIARTPPVRCNYCGHQMPHGIFPECPRCRDQIAMAVLPQLIVLPMMPSDAAIWAKEAYQISDAVLEARKRK